MRVKSKLLGLIMLLMVTCTMFFAYPVVKGVSAQTLTATEKQEKYNAPSSAVKPVRQNPEGYLSGDIVNLVVFFKFKDENPRNLEYFDQDLDEAFDFTLNQSPISAKSYFHEVSLGKVDLNSFLVANKDDYFIAEAPEARERYIKFSDNNINGYSSREYNTLRTALFNDLIRQVSDFYESNLERGNFTEEQLSYFNNLDQNGDSIIDSVTFVYLNDGDYYSVVAEGGEIGYQDLLWPQQSSVTSVRKINGVDFKDFQLMPQDRILTKDPNEIVTIEGVVAGKTTTFCHEMAHKFGLPDLYALDGSDAYDAVAGWDLMSTNHSPNPQYINTYLRYAAGWLDDINFQEIKYNGTYTLNPVSYAATTKNMENYHKPLAYYIRGKGDFQNQIIVFEYREFIGAFEGNTYTTETGIPNNGLLIYRVDLAVTPMSGYDQDIFPGNYGGAPYSIYYFRPELEGGGLASPTQAAFKDNATFGSVSELTNQITFQSYAGYESTPQDLIDPANVFYSNSEIVVSGINISAGEDVKNNIITFTIGGELLGEKGEEVAVKVPYGRGGIEDGVLYNELVAAAGNVTELMSDSLVGVQELIFNDKGITNLTGLRYLDLSTIERLVLDGNTISLGFKDLLSFTNLKVLQLSNMGLTDEDFNNNYFKNIYDYDAISAIDVSRNCLTSIDFLSAFKADVTANTVFNWVTAESANNFIRSSTVVIGAQNIRENFAVDAYEFNFYYTSALDPTKPIQMAKHYRTEVDLDLEPNREYNIIKTTFSNTTVTTKDFVTRLEVTYSTNCPFHYAQAGGAAFKYSKTFYSIGISVDTYLDIRYHKEGTIPTNCGVTYGTQDSTKFEEAFVVTKKITYFDIDADENIEQGTEVSFVDINTVGKYKIDFSFTHNADNELHVEFFKWIHVLSNEVITRQNISDENLYNALLEIINNNNETNNEVLHEQDFARLVIKDGEITKDFTDLNLSIENISSLSGIELLNLTKIKTLNISNNNISDISYIYGMTSLETLYARRNIIEDISVISSFQNLKIVDLSFNNISNVASIQGILTNAGTSITAINLNMNLIDFDESTNRYIKQVPKALILVQLFKDNAHYVNETAYKFFRYADITQGIKVSIKKKNGSTEQMNNTNYFKNEKGDYQIIFEVEKTGTVFETFSKLTLDFTISEYELKPLVYLDTKFLKEENHLLVRERVRESDPQDIIINGTTLAFSDEYITPGAGQDPILKESVMDKIKKNYKTTIKIINPDSANYSTVTVDGKKYVYYKIEYEATDYIVLSVKYEITTYYIPDNKQLPLEEYEVCDIDIIEREITVHNNRPITIYDPNLKLALLNLAKKEITDYVYEYDFYNLATLDLSSQGIVNMTGLSSLKFKELSAIKLNDNNISTSGDANAKINIFTGFKDLSLIDLSGNEITSVVGIENYRNLKKQLTIVLFDNKILPTDSNNRPCYSDINNVDKNLKIVTGVQGVEKTMSAFNQVIEIYYNPVNVNLVSNKLNFGTTASEAYLEEDYKLVYETPVYNDKIVFSYTYGTMVNIVYEINLSLGRVSIPNNVVDVEVYSDYVDEELIYEGIDKSAYTITDIKFQREGDFEFSPTLKNTVLNNFTQTFTVVLNSTGASQIFTRTIRVVDTTKPTISLMGDAYIYLETGAVYEEFGVFVADNYYAAATISKIIPPTTEVDTNTKGVYELTYYAIDDSGNVSDPIVRIVEVDYHDFLRFEIRGGAPLVYVGEATFEAYYMGLNMEGLDYLYYDPEPTFYWYVNGELVHVTKDLVFKYTPETAGRFDVELRINNKIMNARVCNTELLVMFDDKVAMATAIGGTVGVLAIIGIMIWIHILRKKRRELYNEYSNETYRSARRK